MSLTLFFHDLLVTSIGINVTDDTKLMGETIQKCDSKVWECRTTFLPNEHSFTDPKHGNIRIVVVCSRTKTLTAVHVSMSERILVSREGPT